MKTKIILFAFLITTSLHAQENKPVLRQEKAKAIVDTEIASLAREVSADSIRKYIRTLAGFHTRHSLSDTASATQGIGAARRWVAEKFREFSRRNQASMQVTLDPFSVSPNPRSPRVPYTVTMKNVLGTLSGSDPHDRRVMLVSGHLDSRNSDVMDSVGRAPGANDDASGVAVVLELARVMSKKKYPCTIIFMAVQGEEQGLLGARHMAGKMKSEGANLIAMLNNDIVGNTVASETGERNAGAVRIFSEMIPALESDDQAAARNALRAENDSPSRQLARYIKESSDVYLKDFTATLNARPDRFLRGGDHTPFNQLGFAAVRFTEFHENFAQQHQNVRKEKNIQYGDLPQFVDYPYAANVARMNLIAMASMAKAPGSPEAVKMKITLGNITHLSWDSPTAGPAPRGYYVLVRETLQPFWEKKFFIKETTAALPFSKDNYFFAVQSVGEHGHVSLPVMPVPVRE
ncbi:MAG: M28 family metallopeptidase [Chryseosolibacter sp.]